MLKGISVGCSSRISGNNVCRGSKEVHHEGSDKGIEKLAFLIEASTIIGGGGREGGGNEASACIHYTGSLICMKKTSIGKQTEIVGYLG